MTANHTAGTTLSRCTALASITSISSLIVAAVVAGEGRAASCVHPQGNLTIPLLGDVNQSGSVNVADALCGMIVAGALAAQSALPGCLAGPWQVADLNCSGAVDVADTILGIQIAVGTAFSPAVDNNADGCPDMCVGCASPGMSSCLIAATCIPEGQAQVGVDCSVCNPAVSASQWSAADDGTPCSAPNFACETGACVDITPPIPSLVGAGTALDPFLWSDGSIALSCNGYRNPPEGYDPTPASDSGLYLIDPTGGSSSDAYIAYCDMVTEGGGWTVLYSRPVSQSVGAGILQGAFSFISNWNEFSYGLGRESNATVDPALLGVSTHLRYKLIRNHGCGANVPVQGFADYGYVYFYFESGAVGYSLGFGDAWSGNVYKLNTTISTCSISSWGVCPSNQFSNYSATSQATIALGQTWDSLRFIVLSGQCDGIEYAFLR